MRIISGTLKGRKLSSWSEALALRPMTDRVKETVFNVLTPYFFEGCLFLDLFSGTGNLALEALSRGAGQAHAVENHPSCLKLIEKNALKLGLKDKKLILHKKNVFSFLKQKSKTRAFDIIVADPPFAIQAGEKIMKSLENSFLAKKGAVTALETSSREVLKTEYSAFCLFSKKEFNDKKIWFYERQ